MRALGNSDGALVTRGWAEADDVHAAINFVRGRGDVDSERVGANGFSIGAQAALQAAARSDHVRAVMTDGPVASVFADEPAPATLYEWVERPAVWLFYQLLAVSTGLPAPPPLADIIRPIAPRPLLLVSTGTRGERRHLEKLYAAAGEPRSLFEIPETGHSGGPSARPKEYATRLRSSSNGASANRAACSKLVPCRPGEGSQCTHHRARPVFGDDPFARAATCAAS